jgi:hypothetical protein
MEPRALTASSGLAPWSMTVDRTSAAFEKNPTAHRGGQGGLPSWAASPSGGERGSPSQISTPAQKTRKGFPIKTELFRYDKRFFLNTPQFTMIAAAPEGAPPRRISNKQIQKNSRPAVPRRGPEAGFHRIHYDFQGVCFSIALLFGLLTKTSPPLVLRELLRREIPLHKRDFILPPGWFRT